MVSLVLLFLCFFLANALFFVTVVLSSFVFFALFFVFCFFACFLRDRFFVSQQQKKVLDNTHNKKKKNMYTVTSATMTSRARTPTTATTSSSKTTFNSRFQKTKKTSKSCRVSSKSGGFHRQNRNRFGENVHRNNVTGGGQEIAQLADWDEETITTVIAAVLGIGAGLGIPIFFVTQEARDKERIEEIRELNRATLKATGEQMSEEEIKELRPNRYLDRREFKDDD